MASSSPSTSPSSLTLQSKYRLPSGHDIPVLGFGVYQTPAAEASRCVLHALRTGYRHIDSAIAYRNEAACAEGIRAFMHESGTPREDIFFTTKIPPKGLGYESTRRFVKGSLEETGLGYLDLVLLHAPYGGKEARLGAWKALTEAVREGCVRSVGVSNFGVHHLEELWGWMEEQGEGMGGTLSVNQVELHPWLARKDVVEWCKERGVLLQAYCPVVRGQRFEESVVQELAKKHGKSPAQVLLRWSLQMGFIPLPKSVTPARIEENAQIFDFALDDEDMKSLDTGVYEPCAWDPTVSSD